MKQLLFTLLLLAIPSFSMAASEKEYCDAVGGVYHYQSAQLGRIDCVNKTFVYKFATIDNYREAVIELKKQVIGNHSSIMVFFSTAKTFKEESRIRAEVSSVGVSAVLLGELNGKLVTY